MAKSPSPKTTNLTKTEIKKILPLDFQDLNLSLKELKFTAHYWTNGFRGGEAAQLAGYKGSMSSLQTQAQAIMKRPAVNEAMRRLVDLAINPYKDRLEYEVLDRYYRRATYDALTFFDSAGNGKPLDQIPPQWRECIDGVKIRFYGTDAAVRVIDYQLPNRDAALQMLWRMVRGDDGSTNAAGTLPTEARNRIQKLFDGLSGDGHLAAVTKTVSIATTQIHPKRGPGRPQNTPKELQ